MDFRFLEFLKEIINDTLYASIAKLAIAFYLGKKFIQFLITAFNIAYKKKEEQKEDLQFKKDFIELKKDVIDLKKDNLENKERDLKTHEILKELQGDVNAYKKRTHKIETENIALTKTLERNTDLFEKLNNKL
jgi:predicted  nucleic acid-binding Zn-ribbon protein